MQAGCVPGTMGALSDVPGTTGAPSEEDTAVFCSCIPYGLARVADMTYAIQQFRLFLESSVGTYDREMRVSALEVSFRLEWGRGVGWASI